MVAIAVTCALLVGFLAGLISFKVKSRWCPHCGAMTTADANYDRILGWLDASQSGPVGRSARRVV